MKSLLDVLDKWTALQPAKPLFTFLDVAGRETEQFTYASLHARTSGIARHLREDLGFAANDRVLLAFPPGLEMMAAFYGCIRAGLIPVPVYPPSAHGFQSALYKLAHIAADCGATAVLTTSAYRESLAANIRKHNLEGRPEEAQISGLRWLASNDIPASGSEVDYQPSDILFLQYTSGSTSHPKGVIVTHRNVLHNGLLVSHSFPICVSWLPQYHDMGLIGYYIYPALAGGSTYGFSPFDFIQRPALWFESISKYRATATSAPNFAFDYCLRPGRIQEEVLQNADLRSLRFLMTAAEPVHPDTYARFLKTFEPFGLNPEAFYVAYGLAENTLAVSSHGRTSLSLNAKALALRRVRPTTEVSAIASAKRLVSCGQPLGDVTVRIVDPEKNTLLADGHVGEIWVTGESKCAGYWNNPELTQAAFRARVAGDNHHGPEYLRTGDLGFLHQGELYVCGRIKDTIIIRGQNYYPQDIEQVVQEASQDVRRNCVVAFEFAEETEPAIAIVAEVNPRSVPDVHELVAAVRNYLNVEVAHVSLVAPKSLPKTSSGKLMRGAAKQMWLEGRFKEVARLSRDGAPAARAASTSPLDALKLRYNLTGNEDHTLVEAGVDSLDLVVLMHELQEILKEKGAQSLARDVDVSLIQRIKVSDLYRLADYLERNPGEAVQQIQRSLSGMIEEHRRAEARLMQADRRLAFSVPDLARPLPTPGGGAVLLTGGTGFVGPFLINSLLERTHDDIYVLVRADIESAARDRLWAAFESIGPEAARKAAAFQRRVIPVCGNLAKPNLGLSAARWNDLSSRIGAIYHNGAGVNYLFTYEGLRAANVQGTNEVLRFAFQGAPKTFNYVSTTFIFGWATKEVLHETDCNSDMELLDFGYSQSKWVAEQVVADALRRGLPGRIFRPALVSPSISGYGTNLDIAIRLLAFMVNHGIGVDALNQVSFVPVDVVAGNIVAISQIPQSLGRTCHVTRDDYANMMDITSLITAATGQRFDLFSLPSFVPEVIKRCTRQDPLFPLLDFLIGSINNISSMEFKRYDSSGYMRLRDAAPGALPDPSLEDTVLGILRFMKRKDLIAAPVPRADAVPSLPAGNAA